MGKAAPDEYKSTEMVASLAYQSSLPQGMSAPALKFTADPAHLPDTTEIAKLFRGKEVDLSSTNNFAVQDELAAFQSRLHASCKPIKVIRDSTACEALDIIDNVPDAYTSRNVSVLSHDVAHEDGIKLHSAFLSAPYATTVDEKLAQTLDHAIAFGLTTKHLALAERAHGVLDTMMRIDEPPADLAPTAPAETSLSPGEPSHSPGEIPLSPGEPPLPPGEPAETRRQHQADSTLRPRTAATATGMTPPPPSSSFPLHTSTSTAKSP